MYSVKLIINRCNELKGQTKWPTQFDVLDAWLYELNSVIKNIRETSLDYEDRRKREQELMDKILEN